jgi:hypothetical protein
MVPGYGSRVGRWRWQGRSGRDGSRVGAHITWGHGAPLSRRARPRLSSRPRGAGGRRGPWRTVSEGMPLLGAGGRRGSWRTSRRSGATPSASPTCHSAPLPLPTGSNRHVPLLLGQRGTSPSYRVREARPPPTGSGRHVPSYWVKQARPPPTGSGRHIPSYWVKQISPSATSLLEAALRLQLKALRRRRKALRRRRTAGESLEASTAAASATCWRRRVTGTGGRRAGGCAPPSSTASQCT